MIKFIITTILILLIAYIIIFIPAFHSLIMAKIKKINTECKCPLGDKIDYTEKLLDLIVIIIDNEIANLFKTYMRLSDTYPSIKLDTDAKIISEKVFKSINKNIFSTNELIIDPEYLLSYITDMVILKLVFGAQLYNEKIKK